MHYVLNGVPRYKVPDFYLPELDVYLEVGMSAGYTEILNAVESQNNITIIRWPSDYVMAILGSHNGRKTHR